MIAEIPFDDDYDDFFDRYIIHDFTDQMAEFVDK